LAGAGVSGELVSVAGAAISLLNREKTGNFFAITGKRIYGSGNESRALPQIRIPGPRQPLSSKFGLKEMLAELMIENRLLKKSVLADGEDMSKSAK